LKRLDLPGRFFAYLICAGLSDAGYVIAYVAQGWLVEKLTNSPLWLGIVFGAGQVPFLLFSLLGGTLADRYDRRLLIATGNVGLALVAATMAALVAANAMTIALVTMLFFLVGTIVALEHPVDRAWLYDLVSGRQLGRSIALSSIEWSVAATVGPAVGGLIVATAGVAAGYATFAVLSLPLAVLALVIGRAAPQPLVAANPGARSRSPLHPGVVPFCLLIATFTIGINPYVALLPDFASNTLHQDARGYGFLMACTGAGAIAGGIFLSARGEVAHKGRIVTLTMLAGAATLVVFTLLRSPLVAALVLVALGVTQTLLYTLANTFVQQLATDPQRGRANAAFSLAFLGGIPIGNLAVGALASRIGTPSALQWGAGLTVAACVAFWFGAPRARDAA
jgi:MFS family permease